jgi:hypothetical protein
MDTLCCSDFTLNEPIIHLCDNPQNYITFPTPLESLPMCFIISLIVIPKHYFYTYVWTFFLVSSGFDGLRSGAC